MASRPSSCDRPSLSLCYSLADQNFRRTKSLGIFNLSVGLLGALARHAQVGRVHVLSNRQLAGFVPQAPRLTVSEHNDSLSGLWGRIWWDQMGAARAAKRSGCAWTFLPKGFPPWWASLPGALACYVHDTIQVFYRDRYPQSFSRLDRLYFTQSLHATLRRSQVVFTNSEFSRQELLRFARAGRRSAPPIVVAGIGFEGAPLNPGAKPGGVVCLASPWPHKRTDLAVQFMNRWQGETRYTGPVDWVGRAPESLTWPTNMNWRRHERLDPAAYENLVAASRALVFVSEYEGFGMPPVEAVLLGTCPVYSRLPATLEVMGDLGEPFANDDYPGFRRALDRAIETPQSALAGWAQTLRAKYSWDAVADRVVRGLLGLPHANRAEPAAPA